MNQQVKKIKIVKRVKQYGLVFDKRVVDSDTFLSYPAGYMKMDDEYIELVQTPVDL